MLTSWYKERAVLRPHTRGDSRRDLKLEYNSGFPINSSCVTSSAYATVSHQFASHTVPGKKTQAQNTNTEFMGRAKRGDDKANEALISLRNLGIEPRALYEPQSSWVLARNFVSLFETRRKLNAFSVEVTLTRRQVHGVRQAWPHLPGLTRMATENFTTKPITLVDCGKRRRGTEYRCTMLDVWV
ncbi:hypothetical protein BKA56DRAFT_612833 [Ilyonectria sp. MPI-CAGE-AT-0026]|nr:hypothetical protein BKA56DRAFT_612833 [Ilyonectria sp. MPI-CAGE-AT-0026]